MKRLPPLLTSQYEQILRRGLEEDLGIAGDLTTDAIVDGARTVKGRIVARQSGRLAGIRVATDAFGLLESTIRISDVIEDGVDVQPDDCLARVEGSARAILSAERVALNVLGRMSGIATATNSIVEAIRHTEARVVCTRKTLPGLRVLEKYAVRAGGGSNHRFGLYDAVLIKDNHISIAGGVREAVLRVRDALGHLVCVEVEVDTLEQLAEVMELGVDAVLLDNMDVDTLRDAVTLIDGRAIAEASGGITPTTASAIAETGVDLLSVGWITHSAPALDVALDIDEDSRKR